jgi:diguanylate cyclase (GGDEF)-like protein/PAS domain S-box-containing protein
MPIIARLLLTTGAALIIAGVLMLVTVAHEEAEQAKAKLEHVMADQLAILPTTLAEWVVVGDFAVIQKSLDTFVNQHEVASMTYRSTAGAVVTSTGQVTDLRAPRWFASNFGDLSPRGQVSVKIGGREYGRLEVVLTAHLTVNQAWERLQRHLAILTFAVVLDFVGILLVLKNGLRPLAALDQGARAMENGDLTTRIPIQGSPELARTITAFNRMAESIEVSQNALRQMLDRLALAGSVFESASEGVIITNAHKQILEINPAFCRITGYGRAELLGQTPRMLSSGHHDADFYSSMWKSLSTEGKWRGDLWNQHKNGQAYPAQLSIVAVHDEAGKLSNYIGILSDTSELAKQVAERTSELEALNHKLEALSSTDGLTGIANRRRFDERMASEWARAMRVRRPLALLMLDVDLFKSYNDHYGHQAGDECLRSVAQVIDSSSRRSSDLAARYGGEEFALIAADTDAPSAMQLAEKIRHSIELLDLPHAGSPSGKVTISIGVSVVVPDEAQQP